MNAPSAEMGPAARSVAVGRGPEWVGEGFALFKQAPGAWIGITVVWLLISMVVSSTGLGIVNSFLSPIFSAGLMLGCASLSKGEGLRVGHLFAAFQGDRVGALLLMVVIQFGLALLIVLTVAGLALVTVGASAMNLHNLDQVNPLVLVLFALLLVALLLPLGFLVWFAPPLIVLRGVDAWSAMKLSLSGCIKNWLPLLLYGLVCLVVLLLGALPLLLGLLVAIPVVAASVYTSYRDVYSAP